MLRIKWYWNYNEKEIKLKHRYQENSHIISISENSKRNISIVRLITLILLVTILFSLSKVYFLTNVISIFLAIIFGFLSIIIHELIHAIFFKKDVYICINLLKGIAFTYGTETMTKGKYIITSFAPIFILGVIPFVIYLFFNSNLFLGVFGIYSIMIGISDIYNIYNVLKNTPKKCNVFLSDNNAYWFV